MVSVVPVSMIPAVDERMFVLVLYRICWLIPQNVLDGLVVVRGTKLIDPVNLLESVPPNESSPLTFPTELVGSNDIAT